MSTLEPPHKIIERILKEQKIVCDESVVVRLADLMAQQTAALLLESQNLAKLLGHDKITLDDVKQTISDKKKKDNSFIISPEIAQAKNRQELHEFPKENLGIRLPPKGIFRSFQQSIQIGVLDENYGKPNLKRETPVQQQQQQQQQAGENQQYRNQSAVGEAQEFEFDYPSGNPTKRVKLN